MIGYVIQIAGRDQPSERHLPGAMGFQLPRRHSSQSYIGSSGWSRLAEEPVSASLQQPANSVPSDPVPISEGLDAGVGVATARFNALGGARADATVMGCTSGAGLF